jgi:hypothetical protein
LTSDRAKHLADGFLDHLRMRQVNRRVLLSVGAEYVAGRIVRSFATFEAFEPFTERWWRPSTR